MGIDIVVISLFILLILVALILAFQAKMKQLYRQKEVNKTRVFCRFCRDDFALPEPLSDKADLTEPEQADVAHCPQCKRLQWRGSSRDLT